MVWYVPNYISSFIHIGKVLSEGAVNRTTVVTTVTMRGRGSTRSPFSSRLPSRHMTLPLRRGRPATASSLRKAACVDQWDRW